MGLFGNMFKSDNDRALAKLRKIADMVEAKSDEYAAKSDAELKETTTILKKRVADGETLNAVLPDAFALVREASWRVLGMKHFYVQILGGITLFQGRISEMKTGEGKTLVATLPAFLQALEGKGVHIITVNEYLVQYQSEWMGKVFNFLGMTVGVTLTGMTDEQKRAAYNCDVTYGTNNEFGFDYLRDNMVVSKNQRVARGYRFAIVDEVDSILIDEARTPLIISGKGTKSNETYKEAAKFAKTLKEKHYEIDEKDKQIRLTEDGVLAAEKFFKIENISDIANIELNHHINNALRAQFIMKVDNDYIVDGNEIVIIDDFTGRLMEGRKYSGGLHQAIEAKEGVEVKDESKTLATITFQNFFRLYEKLSGMTGTAKTEEMEFNKIYYLDVVQIPTNKPVKRVDYPDIVFKNEKGKFAAIVKEIKEVNKTGRPILIGTITIEKSEELSKELQKNGIKHTVLNAKQHKLESMIIAQAGRLGTVTIATNMAGRGTDILLGGNPEFMAKQRLREVGATEQQIEFCASLLETDNEELLDLRKKYNAYLADFKKVTDKEKQQVVEVGGLHIIGTERHESRRIDNQLRGRAGRQGDPGSSVFFVSMQDELLRRFGGDTLQNIMNFMNIKDDEPLQYKMLSKRIEGAQKRIEGHNFSIRHAVLKYDDVLNKQRELIYKERNKVLDGIDVHEEVLNMIEELAEDVVYDNIDDNKLYSEWDLDALNTAINTRLFDEEVNIITPEIVEDKESDEVADFVVERALARYEEKMKMLTHAGVNTIDFEGFYLLRVVDSHWMQHIDFMDMLRKEIGIRQYGQHDPIVAYKEEGFEVFDKMISEIRNDVASFLSKFNKIQIEVTPEQHAKLIEEQKKKHQNLVTNVSEKTEAKSDKLVGRNSLCPCGSGKKYKNCHGQDE